MSGRDEEAESLNIRLVEVQENIARLTTVRSEIQDQLQTCIMDQLFQEEELTSSKNVKNLIKTFLKNESPSHPLSDQEITNLLNEKGYRIARRTVAKYREQLKILPSKMRRSL